MRIACIDDVPEEADALLSLFAGECAKYSIHIGKTDRFCSGDAFFRVWHPGMYRIVFLDIFLKDEIGIRLAGLIRRIDPGVLIVFCSSSNGFASESYAVRADYYLVKPVSAADIGRMIPCLNLLAADEDMVELPDRSMLPLSQFLYSEYHNHKITLYLKKDRSLNIWMSQTDLAGLLEPYHYCLPVTPGTIINLKEVRAFDGDIFKLSDGTTVPISKNRKTELKRQYRDYLFAELRK